MKKLTTNEAKILKFLTTASLNRKFTGSYKKYIINSKVHDCIFGSFTKNAISESTT